VLQVLQQWTETSAFFIWLRESTSVWAYPTVFFIHSLGLIFAAGASIIINARVLGAASELPVAPFARYFRAVWIAFALTIASGVVMLLADLTRLDNKLFAVKMGFVAAAIVLTLVMRRRIERAGESGATRLLAAVSLVCWLGAITSGRFMAYLQ
jgi:hypothetical protein